MSETRSGTNSNRPFLLTPAYRYALWGGDNLRDRYGQAGAEADSPAESWVCSTHTGYESIASCGEFAGRTLAELIDRHPDWLGDKYHERGELPVIVKLIDAREALSLQVHPDYEYARTHEEGGMGKTELWYILDAEPGSSVTYGFLHDTSREEVSGWIEEGTLTSHLRTMSVSRGDTVLVDAGTVHGIGAGLVVAEVQENSNLTYRLWDYDRVDASGCKRPLHIDKALDVLDYGMGRVIRRPIRQIHFVPGASIELLGRCRYFETHRIRINTLGIDEGALKYDGSDASYEIFLCTDGELVVDCMGLSFEMTRGSCMFIPAHSDTINCKGRCELLRIRS